MKKSLAKNPNMLRTMIGTGLVLVLILSYAVYSNTLDSEYYGYKTTNESEIIDLSPMRKIVQTGTLLQGKQLHGLM